MTPWSYPHYFSTSGLQEGGDVKTAWLVAGESCPRSSTCGNNSWFTTGGLYTTSWGLSSLFQRTVRCVGSIRCVANTLRIRNSRACCCGRTFCRPKWLQLRIRRASGIRIIWFLNPSCCRWFYRVIWLWLSFGYFLKQRWFWVRLGSFWVHFRCWCRRIFCF